MECLLYPALLGVLCMLSCLDHPELKEGLMRILQLGDYLENFPIKKAQCKDKPFTPKSTFSLLTALTLH